MMHPGTYDNKIVFLPDKTGIVRYSEVVSQWQQHVDAGSPPVVAVIRVAESYGVDNGMIGGIVQHMGMMTWWVA